MNFQMLRDMIAARRNSFAFIAFLALLNLSVLLFLSLWQQPELKKAQVEWFAKRDALAKGEVLGDAARYHNGVRDLELFQKRLVPKKEFAGLLSQIYETAKNNSLTLKGVSYKPAPVKGEALLSYGISFTVQGKYASVKSFLADLVRYPEMVTVDSVALNNPNSIEESVNLKVQVTAYLKTEGA